MKEEQISEPWIDLAELLEHGTNLDVEKFLDELGKSERILVMSRLDDEHRTQILTRINPELAAELMEDLDDGQAADIIEELTAPQAAAIIDEMSSDGQADVLGQMEDEKAEAILQEMDPEEAEDARLILEFPADSAGGMMITEYLAYPEYFKTIDVINDLKQFGDKYNDYEVQYTYIIDEHGKLTGVLPIRNLLLSGYEESICALMIPTPISVTADTHLDEIKEIFEENNFIAVPVTDNSRELIGIVMRRDVLEALDARDNRVFLNFTGIVGGEESRSMPLLQRSFRRLSWLSVNICLNFVSASVIAFNQDTLAAAITLAVFLPIISDLSGSTGNQAVAVSIRELSLGMLKPHEIMRVLAKEAGVGLINGIILGTIIGIVALIWKGNIFLGLVVGGSLAINSILAVCLGGSIPLILRSMKIDPALASSPLLTTFTDTCGFFLVLQLAATVLSKL